MNKLLLYFLLSLCFVPRPISAQKHHERFENIDVQHYSFELHLHDESNRIEGRARIAIMFLQAANSCQLDLVNPEDDGTGMKVTSVVFENDEISFTHKNPVLAIDFPRQIETGECIEIEINYHGTPADGLIISENSHGGRTFFGDNWPDRARHWLPTSDHPSDKATVEFLVYAPAHYKVVSNGYLAEKKAVSNEIGFTHWKEDIPISTKVMVIGAADFAVKNDTAASGIPVSSWIFKDDTASGFHNYRFGAKALDYFSELIGPYSYEKLAHVQSKTRYGGMENAGCIFYNEGSAISHRSQEELFAHEVAHQWFGNSATEQNWHHLWLSEGFATYLTHVYMQHFYGNEAFRKALVLDRERVIAFAHRHSAPIIDTTVIDYIRLLNANSYQKAGWFLHMLRQKLGDDIFLKGLRNYYAKYRNSTALTSDFRTEMEKVSGLDLKPFFDQWLRHPGHPRLRWSWEQTDENTVTVKLQQKQKEEFHFPLLIRVFYEDGTSRDFPLEIDKKESKTELAVKGKILRIALDPEVNLLFEELD